MMNNSVTCPFPYFQVQFRIQPTKIRRLVWEHAAPLKVSSKDFSTVQLLPAQMEVGINIHSWCSPWCPWWSPWAWCSSPSWALKGKVLVRERPEGAFELPTEGALERTGTVHTNGNDPYLCNLYLASFGLSGPRCPSAPWLAKTAMRTRKSRNVIFNARKPSSLSESLDVWCVQAVLDGIRMDKV